MRIIAGIALVALVAACVPAARHRRPSTARSVALAPNVRCADTQCEGYSVFPYIRTRSRYGIGCMGNVPPGTQINPELPPQSYLASDVGKPDFPALRPEERATLQRIEQSVRSPTLRIAWVGARGGREFIVFDATDGPCEVWAAGYQVLNGYCNEFYQPGENPYRTHAVPDCFGPKRPWMTPSPRARRARSH